MSLFRPFRTFITAKTRYKERKGFYSRLVGPILSKLRKSGGIVLEVGCGGGEVTCSLWRTAQPTSMYVASDLDVDRLRSTLVVLKDLGVDTLCFDAHKISLRKNSVDLVVAISLVEHLTNPSTFLEEVKRVLKPSGWLVLQYPNINGWLETHTKLPLFLIPRCLRQKVAEGVLPEGYGYLNTEVEKENLEKRLDHLGFWHSTYGVNYPTWLFQPPLDSIYVYISNSPLGKKNPQAYLTVAQSD